MRIASFDIGIKNLAFSIIEIDGERHSIIGWDVINVLSEIEEPCVATDACDRIATHSCKVPESGTIVGCCAKVKCIKAFDAKYPPSSFPRTAIKKRHAVKQHSLMELCQCILSSIGRYKDLILTADVIVLENQPVLKNPTMKSVQMFIYSYLLIHGAKNIALFNARFKLNEYSGPEVDVSHKKTDYAKRKALSVAYAESIVNSERCLNGGESSIWYVLFQLSKKKDDLADCYLQGLTYYREKYIPHTREKTKKTKKAKVAKKIKDETTNTGTTLNADDNMENKEKPTKKRVAKAIKTKNNNVVSDGVSDDIKQ